MVCSMGKKMSQSEIIELLEKEERWMTSKEIGIALDISSGCVNSALSKMFKWNEVLKKNKSKRTWTMWPRGPFLWRAKEEKEDE